jgi:hypothetical protein
VLHRNAVGDISPEVKTEAAKLIGDVAPHYEYPAEFTSSERFETFPIVS